MKFNKFYINIVLRIILIVITCFIFVYFFERDDNILTSVFVVVLGIIQTAYLIHYVNKTNRYLADFLIHLQQGDTSGVFTKENIEKTFKGLRNSFEKINLEVKQTKIEKEQKEHYLKFVIDNIDTGLLAFNDFGNIEFINNQAKVFLNIENINLLNINELNDDFIKIINETKLSESSILKKIIHDELYYLAFSFSEFKIDNKKVKFCTIHDVKQEIDANEIESWQKLTSILTHEMMNSITPITSLAHAIKRYLVKNDEIKDESEISNELISDIVENADIIENRSKSVLDFINNYRTISKLPKPKLEKINVYKLLQKTLLLFDNKIEEKNINIEINVKDKLSIEADSGMVEQVIINLLKNSIEALSDSSNPFIKLNSFIDKKQRVKIQVIDNGHGIPTEVLDSIFIPFYTTKEKGSGIGLSLSRQIMRLHNGTITVTTKKNKETVFCLVF